MGANTFGELWRLTSFGESHGPALGGVLDGCPAGIALNLDDIQAELDARKPGQKPGAAGLVSTARKESDRIQVLSGIFEGYTTGTSIGFTIANEDQRSRDYGPLATAYRPGHADCSYDAKYGRRDYRGGGRSSGRETAVRVAGGAIAQAFLANLGIRIYAATVEMGGLAVPEKETKAGAGMDMEAAAHLPYFAAHAGTIPAWDALIAEVRAAGDTVGGIVQIEARCVPAGLGEPVFDKLDARLAAALMSVGAVKGVEVGAGFAAARLRGSSNNDPIVGANPLRFARNAAGGILGGISSGQDIVLRVAVKPIPSIAQEQQTVNAAGQSLKLCIGGRHDICAIPRIVPVLKAMTALVLADAVLLQRRMGRD